VRESDKGLELKGNVLWFTFSWLVMMIIELLVVHNNMYWGVFVPRNLLPTVEKMGSLSATVTQIRPSFTFGDMPS